MYKLLLCWRYLRTRYIALVCIVSVMLGVATMIVVNSVMEGFSDEMNARLNGMLGDLVFEVLSMDGAPDADAHMARIRAAAGDDVAGMSPTVSVPALMYLTMGGESRTHQVTLVGIDEATYSSVSQFGDYLQHPANRKQLEFSLRENGYDAVDHSAEDPSLVKPREQMRYAGWRYRRYKAETDKRLKAAQAAAAAVGEPATVGPLPGNSGPIAASGAPGAMVDPFAASTSEGEGRDFDPAVDVHTGIVLGIGICGYRMPDGTDQFVNLPGDDVRVGFPTASMPPKLLSEFYTVVDFYESKMAEYDQSFAFVPLKALQRSRGMIDRTTGVGRFTTIQIKLREGADANVVRDKIRNAFPAQMYLVSTWQDKQGPLLAAVQMETAVLNVLLFLIIAVAGFGILAIFTMIVVEKTRDIGILKSLGASGRGVMGIFLGYGLSLGLVGAGVGTAAGLAFTAHINEIAGLLGEITGRPVFDPSVYYFYKIPTTIDPFTVSWVAGGAVLIAVLSSILPAWRAARLHPVRALRFE